MALKRHNPTSPGRRQLITPDRAEVSKKKPERSLTKGRRNQSAGRNVSILTMSASSAANWR